MFEPQDLFTGSAYRISAAPRTLVQRDVGAFYCLLMITERRVVTVLAIATVAFIVFMLFPDSEETTTADPSSPTATATPAPSPTAPSSQPDETQAPAPAVAPVGAGRCPKGFRVKGETPADGVKVYHRPGTPAYGETRAEECFASAEDAQAAGYSAA